MTKRLLIAVLLLGVLVAITPLVVRWAYLDWNKKMVVLAIAPALPLAAFAMGTLWQERQGKQLTTFAAGPLSAALFLMSSWVLGAALLGFFVIVLGVFVLPFSASLLALAWVQPRGDQQGWTVFLAIVAIPLVVWFAGRADESVSEALISGAALVVIVVVLFWMRRVGNTRARSVDA